MNELTLLIPAKNEAESLPIVLDELKKYNYKINIILHITDLDTIKAIREYDVNIIYQENSGYGDALIQGIKQCETKYFCIFNADGSFNPSEINQMLKTLQSKKLDFIFASRYQENSGSDDDTLITLIGNYIFTYIGKIFFGLNINDILYTFLIRRYPTSKYIEFKGKKFFFLCRITNKSKKIRYENDVNQFL
ncbi:glycosyltransferase family 2 protein [Candidatus Pelagibacter sp. Uisw_114]